MKISLVVLLFVFVISILCLSQITSFDDNFSAAALQKDTSGENFSQSDSELLPKMENPRIVVKKSERKLELFDGETLVKTYKIALGFAPVGDKEKQGDGRTPEGEFYVFTKNAKSRFYLSLGISYPNIEDAERGFKAKLITKLQRDKIVKAIKNKKTPLQNTRLGGEIYIHGNGNANDWTWGCVALKDENIKELFDTIPVGTKVTIES